MGQKSEKEVMLKEVLLNRGVDKAQLCSESDLLSSSGQTQNVHKGTFFQPMAEAGPAWRQKHPL